MVAAKTGVRKSTRPKGELAAPYLEHLIFTKCSSERIAGANGIPSDFDPKGALLELTVAPSCTPTTSKRSRGVRAAIALNLEAKAVSGEDGAEFYSGDVRAVGFFVCDPSMKADDIKNEALTGSGYFDAAFSVVHAIASRELERQIELTGIPAPVIPMSKGHAEVTAMKNKP
jgi:hypothetical protein